MAASYNVRYSPQFEKSFVVLPKDIQKKASNKLKLLSVDPFNFTGRLNIKKLVGNQMAASHRLKIDYSYRILFSISDDEIHLHLVIHRKDAYR